MSKCARNHPGMGAALLPVVVVFCAVFCAAAVNLGRPMHVSASSDAGSLTFTPASGAVGTAVTVTITPLPDSVGATYALYAGMGATAQDACADPRWQVIPDVTPFILGKNGARTTFAWPAALDHGPYWLCGAPPPNGGATGYIPVLYNSSVPFTVIGAVPIPTTTATSVVANVPASGIVAGNSFTIAITGWSSPSDTPPAAVEIAGVLPDPQTFYYQGPESLGGMSAPFTTKSGHAAGDYTLTVSLPPLYPGTYWALVADQSGYVHSQEFTVLAAPTPTEAPAPPTANAAQTNTGDAPSLLVVGILLAVALVMLASVLVRRRARLQRQRAR